MQLLYAAHSACSSDQARDAGWSLQAMGPMVGSSMSRRSSLLFQTPNSSEGAYVSGHSKWHSIKHKKAAADAKRGKIFTKLIREITVAARLGGGDPEMNPRLRLAVSRAKAANMPNDNIDRAVKKGTGELEGVNYEELLYEGYGPGGVAVMVEIMTDNRNRTASEIRKIFSKLNCSLGESGCVAWIFSKKGLITVPKDSADEDQVLEAALEAGANDVKDEGDEFELVTGANEFEDVKQALEAKNIKLNVAELSMIPQNTVKLDAKQAETMLKLMDELDNHDDVQNVHANFDIDEEIMERISA